MPKNNNPNPRRNASASQSTPTMAAAGRARTAAEDKLWAALRAHPGSTAAQLALAAGIGKSTAGKFLVSWHTEGSVTRTSSTAQDKRGADRWSIMDSDETIDTPETPSATEDAEAGADDAASDPDDKHQVAVAQAVSAQPSKPSDEPESSRSRRLGKGELRGMVEDYLNEHPGEQFSPNAIGKALNRSAGAVNNALEKLVLDGYAEQAQERPKRFTAKPADG